MNIFDITSKEVGGNPAGIPGAFNGAMEEDPSTSGPADTYRFEFHRVEPRDDPKEFIIMCNLFRKYLYVPFGTNPTYINP